MAKAAEVLWWLGLLGSSEVKIAGVILFLFFFFFCPWEKVLAKGIPLGIWSGMLALRLVVE